MQLKPEDMMADHTVDQGKDTVGSIPKEILDCFWGIAELDDEMRHQNSVKLLNILSSKKKEENVSFITFSYPKPGKVLCIYLTGFFFHQALIHMLLNNGISPE